MYCTYVLLAFLSHRNISLTERLSRNTRNAATLHMETLKASAVIEGARESVSVGHHHVLWRGSCCPGS